MLIAEVLKKICKTGDYKINIKIILLINGQREMISYNTFYNCIKLQSAQ